MSWTYNHNSWWSLHLALANPSQSLSRPYLGLTWPSWYRGAKCQMGKILLRSRYTNLEMCSSFVLCHGVMVIDKINSPIFTANQSWKLILLGIKKYWLEGLGLGGWGATRMARGGIRLVHGHTKSTLITYFSGMKIDPKYAFLHAFSFICQSCPSKICLYDQKHTLFFQFCTFLHP